MSVAAGTPCEGAPHGTQELSRLVREMSGKPRCDLTLLLRDPAVFRTAVAALAAPFRHSGITAVAAIDAMGFALGGAVAHSLQCGLVLVRKGAKVAWPTATTEFVDYTGGRKVLEIAEDAVKPGDHIVVVDDWAETGAQLKAAIALVEQLGGVVSGAAMINIDPKVRADQALANYVLHGAVQYCPDA